MDSLGCRYCSARFNTEWERIEHERDGHPVTPSLSEDAARVMKKLQSSRANGDPAKYAANLSVAEAHEAAALIQSLSSQLAEAQAELIRRINHWSELYGVEHHRAEKAEADRDRLAAELERKVAVVREALEPFVQHYEPWMDEWPDNTECRVHSRHTFGQLRRARTALASLEDRA